MRQPHLEPRPELTLQGCRYVGQRSGELLAKGKVLQEQMVTKGQKAEDQPEKEDQIELWRGQVDRRARALV